MTSDQERLNKRIRETIALLSEDELVEILKTSKSEYGPYALKVARDELTRRRLKPRPPVPVSAVENLSSELDAEKAGTRNVSGCYIEMWSDKNYEGEYKKARRGQA